MKRLPARLAAALARCQRLLDSEPKPRDPRKPRLQLETLDTREMPALITTPANLTATLGQTISISALAYVSDTDGHPITISEVRSAGHGSVSSSGTNGVDISYTVTDATFTGTDSFNYLIDDGQPQSTLGTVYINVTSSGGTVGMGGTNTAPTAYGGYATAVAGIPEVITVPSASSSSYAYDSDGDGITVIAVGSPSHGTVSQSGNVITYTADPSFGGEDTFSYTIDDGHGHTAGSTIRVGVSINAAPTAYGGYANVLAGSTASIVIPSASSSAYAYDADGDNITVISVGTPAHGTVTQSGNTITYAPDTGFTGTDTFSYAITDGHHGHTATGVFNIGVSTVTNVAPTAYGVYTTATAGTAALVTIPSSSSSAYAYDADGDSITLSAVGAPGRGTATGSGNAITYTPDSSFRGTDTFSYSINDGHGHTAGASVTVVVTGNSAPTGLGLSPASVPENSGAGATVGLFSTTDPDTGDTFSYTLVSGTGSADNTAFYISGNQLRAFSDFDYETKNSYDIRVRTTDQGGLYFERTLTVSVTDVNENTSVSLSGAGSSAYGDSVTFSATVTPLTHGPAGPDGTVTFKDGSTTLGTGTLSGGVATFSTSALGAGSHSITAVYGGGSGYNGSSSSSATQTVSKAHLTVTAADKTKVYGDANPALTITITGFKNGETLATSGVTGVAGASTSATTASHVGDYTITASAGSLAAANYDFPTLVDGKLTVTKATLTITADDKSKAYGAAVPTLTASYGGFVNGDTSSSLSSAPTLSTSATSGSSVAGGPYSITASGAASSDYTISYVPGSLTVTAATLSVTADDQSKAYGASLPTLTYSASGYVNGDDSGVLSGALATTATSTSNAGSYSITQGTLSAGSNYTLSFAAGTLTVTKVSLTVTAADKSKAYGASVPSLTYTASGFVNGDDSGDLSGSLSTTAALGSNAGSYPITQGSLGNGNYTISFTSGTLTVTKVALTVTADDQSKIYGDDLPELTYSASGFVNGDDESNLTGSLSTTATLASDVGSYSITQGSLGSGNYTITFTGATLDVTAAELTVTANNRNKVYGDSLPSLTYSTSGLVNGDTAGGVLTGALATDATSASDVGSYSITQGTLAAGSNYTLTFNAATLSVTPATLSVTADHQTKVYGDDLPELTYSASGFVNGDDESVLSGALATDATLSSDVGSYSITQGSLSAGSNYTISYHSSTLSVTAATLTVTADDQDKVYGAAVPTLTYSASGFVNGDPASVLTGALATTATLTSHVGTYSITQGTLSAGSNYSISYTAGTLTVKTAPVTVTASTPDAYEAGTQAGTFTFSRATPSAANGAAVVISYSLSGTADSSDYSNATSGSVTIPANQTSVTLNLNPTNDNVMEPAETVVLTITSVSNTDYSGSGSATVTIHDNDQTISVSKLQDGAEPGTPGIFRFARAGDLTVPTTVNVDVSGTATAGDDYVALGKIVDFGIGVSRVDVFVNVTDDDLIEGTETVIVSLAAPTDTHYLLASGSASQATVAILDDDAPPPKPDDDCGCSNTGNQTTTSASTGTSGSGNESSDGVVYATGAISVSNSDLSSVGFGQEWGVSRSYANIPGYAQASYAANNTVIGQNTYLITDPTGIIVAAEDGKTSQYFDPSGGSFVPRFFTQDTLTHDSDAGEYTLTTADGKKLVYNDFDSSRPGAQKGQLKSVTDAQGNTTAVTAYETGGEPQEVQRSSTAGGVTTIESYLYSYVDSGTNAGKIDSITLRQKVDSGSWATVRTAEYAYYDTGSSLGTPGDLKSEVTKDADGQALDQSYSRYYTADSATGFAGGLKYTVSGDAYDRLTAAYPDPDTATDAELAPFATHYFEYDNVRRVTRHTESGTGCSTCADGLGTTTYSYATSPFENGFNNWQTKTVETLADGTVNTVYSNFAGETMLTVTRPAGSEAQWLTYQRYDESGRLIMTAQPSAVSGFDDSYADLLHDDAGNYEFLRDGEGLISTTTYSASTTATPSAAGNVEGYQYQSFLQRGEGGTPVVQDTTQYFSRTAGDVTVYPVAATTQYRNDDGTGAQTTSYAYTYFSGTIQPETVTVTRPTVTTGENGSNTAESSVAVMDDRGRVTWTKDAGGFISYTEYDDATGGVIKTINDVDTTQTGTFANLPSGWTTPTGGGLQQTTTYELDDQGRATKVTDPNGNVTYTVYNDADHETRTYSGWNSTTDTPTGPTTVSREDREHGYTESLTMSAMPDVSDGRPTGTEDISDVQSLSRQVVNDAGQVLYSDQYTDLTGVTYSQSSVTLGTAGTNYLRTTYAYDDVGQLRKTVTPAGTISRTVYDGLGRTVSEWVGTDDTPTSGYWSPSNTAGTNLVKVSEVEYDNGEVGDGNVTKQTQIPGGGEAERVSTVSYDWRNRAVATKAGVETSEDTSLNRPVSYTEYDNLGEAVVSEQYDGDGLSITTDADSDGVPDRPDSSELRAKSVTSYDEQDRVFRNENYSVDPSSGSVSTYSLRTDSWFDSRGNTIKSSSPGGLVSKTTYDGLGRPTVSYVTDGGGDTAYSDADDVTGDAVLSQTEPTYDAGGRVLMVTTRDRFDDETGTGALGTPSTGNKARVSYQASFYDDANRLTASEDVGTNGGSAFTRPSSPDDRDDTHLITSYGYDAAGLLHTTTDPMGLVSKTYYDAAGRTVKTIKNYVDGTVSEGDDKTVEYVYGATGQLAKLQTKLTGGGQQETGYVYGVTTGQGSTLDSNEIAYQTEYPDAMTGNASAGEVDSTAVNNLGQVLTRTDRNGTTHAYAYDVLGRQISDTVTTLGSGVDGAVRRVETNYDTQGNVLQITSYDAVTGGNVVNQIQRSYNGLGQMTTEYQATEGSVDPETTPKVQYAFSEMADAANHSRLTSMTYPNGRELDYEYGSGVDDAISRLSSINDDSTILEGYSYLGLGTVVDRTHPETGVDLTYAKLGGESDGAAGDQYAGLDAFGRLTDQRWTTAAGTATDRRDYGYDRDGNRTYMENMLASGDSESYSYDGLNQLTGFDRGTLNGAKTGITGTASRSQDWDYDALGNFDSQTTDGTAQTRTANNQNEITSISGANTPTYDADGNLTTDETGRTFTYDAWNRLATVTDSGSSLLATYKWDGTGRRVEEIRGGTTTDLYSSSQWQVLEERVDRVTTTSYAWSPVYVDAMIARDRDTDANGSLDERLYAMQDANYNVIGLMDTSGNVVERYQYDPFGQFGVLDGSGEAIGSSAYGWNYLFQGGRWDTDGGVYSFRNRELSPTLGRWLQMDPIGFAAGDGNLYRYISNNPTDTHDPSGLDEEADISYSPATNADLIATMKLDKETWDAVKGPLAPILNPAGGNKNSFVNSVKDPVNGDISFVFLSGMYFTTKTDCKFVLQKVTSVFFVNQKPVKTEILIEGFALKNKKSVTPDVHYLSNTIGTDKNFDSYAIVATFEVGFGTYDGGGITGNYQAFKNPDEKLLKWTPGTKPKKYVVINGVNKTGKASYIDEPAGVSIGND